MRALLIATLCWAAAQAAQACSCFPPEVRAKTAQEALQSARVAVLGRVLAPDAGGEARLLVLESFKGPARGATVVLLPKAATCEAAPAAVGDEVLLLSFGEAPTACDQLPGDHYLLDALRTQQAFKPASAP